MVHSSVLIDLRQASSNGLTFVSSKVPEYKGPHDDIITFALAANKSGRYKKFNSSVSLDLLGEIRSLHTLSCISGVPLYICNDNIYGFVMVPLEQGDSLQLDFMQLTNLKLEVLGMYHYNTSTAIYKLFLVSLSSVVRTYRCSVSLYWIYAFNFTFFEHTCECMCSFYKNQCVVREITSSGDFFL
jgi:hypothetical protein